MLWQAGSSGLTAAILRILVHRLHTAADRYAYRSKPSSPPPALPAYAATGEHGAAVIRAGHALRQARRPPAAAFMCRGACGGPAAAEQHRTVAGFAKGGSCVATMLDRPCGEKAARRPAVVADTAAMSRGGGGWPSVAAAHIRPPSACSLKDGSRRSATAPTCVYRSDSTERQLSCAWECPLVSQNAGQPCNAARLPTCNARLHTFSAGRPRRIATRPRSELQPPATIQFPRRPPIRTWSIQAMESAHCSLESAYSALLGACCVASPRRC